tara:strand:+ start:171 stop:512 length:342 start_codon:yes stop_codon:yes gene_type:complete
MRAKVKVDHRDMKGNSYDIVRVVNGGEGASSFITLRYNEGGILVDFNLSELEILNEGNSLEVHRNHNYRDGVWLGYCPINKGYILEYNMPSGRKFKNLVKNPFDKSNYSTKIK